MPTTAPPTFCHKPTRAETARANGALSRGPVTEAGKRRSSRNALTHGLRASRHLAVEALGESPAEAEAHFAAVRAELAPAGPVARHLAETVASAMLRGTRADRLEGELLAGLARGGRSVAKTLHDDQDARAALTLLHRYRREADGELRRSLDALTRLHRARTENLLPDGREAAEAQAGLDESLAELPRPIEPRIAKIKPVHELAGAANDDVPARPSPAPPPLPSPPPPPPTGAQLLRQYRWFAVEATRARMWRRITRAQRAAILDAAGAGDRDPEASYETLRPLLAGKPAIEPTAPAPT